MKINKIYLDMDGVLADFDRGVKELLHLEPVEQSKATEAQDDILWAAAKEVGNFYDKLEPIEGAVAMYEKLHSIYGDKCEILSAVPKPRRGIVTAKDDKINWVRRILSKDIVVNIVHRAEKKDFAKDKGCILIDDLEKNIREWEAAGGTGIHFTSVEETLEKLALLAAKPMTGLVMEGGAMRGMFTAGVIDVFMENGITFDGAVGVSAGATFGCNIKSKQIGRAIRYNCKYCGDDRYGSFKSFIKTGDIFDSDFCYHTVPYELDVFDTDTFKENPMEFYVVAADVESGKPYYHKCLDGKEADIEWIKASASVPIVSNMVEIDGHKYLDGGIADSIPLKFIESIGYDRNVVILTQPDGFVKKKNKATPICRFKYRKYPNFVHTFANRQYMYNDTTKYVKEREEAGDIFVIRPPHKLELSSIEKDPENLRKAYNLGRDEALKAINERNLKEWLR